MITTHPTISLLSGTDIISKTADFVAKTSNDTKILFDYEVSKHTITRKILEKGKAMKTFYLNLFLNMVNDSDCAMSGIVDYWTAGQTFLQPYSGIIACGLNSNWEWVFFPLSLSKLDCETAHTAKFTYDLFLKECSFDLIKSKDPFFVCTDNAPAMKAAFDGRFDIAHKIYRFGCIEHRLATCVSDSFKKTHLKS